MKALVAFLLSANLALSYYAISEVSALRRDTEGAASSWRAQREIRERETILRLTRVEAVEKGLNEMLAEVRTAHLGGK